MKKTILRSLALTTALICLLSTPASQAASKKARYPVVEAVKGPALRVEEKITVAGRKAERSEQERNIRRNEIFRDKAWLRIGDQGEVRILLRKKAILTINEKTEALMPSIDWQDGEVEELDLFKGSFRYICDEEKGEEGTCNLKVSTPLSETKLPQGDFILSYDPTKPQVEISVLQGEVSFQGLENESSTLLKAGQKISFTGVLESGEPAYDILLKGRRVAKGKIGEIQQIPATEINDLQKQEEQKKKIVKLPPKTKRLPSQICDQPWGELNQCVWTCEKNKKNAKECRLSEGAICVRQRCNANGQWTDRLELSTQTSPCQAKPFVGACDY